MDTYNISRRDFLGSGFKTLSGIAVAASVPSFLTGCGKGKTVEPRLWIPADQDNALQVYPANVNVKPIPIGIGKETLGLSGISVSYSGSELAKSFEKPFGVFYNGNQWVLIEDPTNELTINKGELTLQGIIVCLNTGSRSSGNVNLGSRRSARLVEIVEKNADLSFSDAKGKIQTELSAVGLDNAGTYTFVVVPSAEDSNQRGLYVVNDSDRNFYKKGRDITFKGKAITKVSELTSRLGGTLGEIKLFVEDPNSK